MKSKQFLLVFLTLILTACGAQSRVQDTPEIHLSRNFGYSSLNSGDIQGNFTIAYSGPSNVTRVVFMIDGKPMKEVVGKYPYTFKFNTGSYTLGEHTLSAIGYTQDGTELRTRDVHVIFVSAGEGWKSALKIVIPVLGLVLLATLVGIGGPLLLNHGKKLELTAGMPRDYGLRGGAICPRCNRPYVLHLFSPNVGLHKYDRCPYCGKWALVRPRSLADLREAERVELEQASASKQTPASSEEEKLRKDLEDSRYQDL